MNLKRKILSVLVSMIMGIRVSVIWLAGFIWRSLFRWVVHFVMAIVMGPLYALGLEDNNLGESIGVACIQAAGAALLSLIVFAICDCLELIDGYAITYFYFYAALYSTAIVVEWIVYIFSKAPTWQRDLNESSRTESEETEEMEEKPSNNHIQRREDEAS